MLNLVLHLFYELLFLYKQLSTSVLDPEIECFGPVTHLVKPERSVIIECDL